MRLVLTTYLTIVFCWIFGQAETKGAIFVSNSEVGDGVLVKWLYADVYHPSGFDVYRSEGGDNWIKLNSKPVSLDKNANVSNYDKETQQLYTAIVKSSFEEFRTNLVRAFVMIKAILNNDFARDIGIFYQDISAASGKKYTYKIVIAGSGSEIGVSSEINAGSFDGNYVPKDITIERKKKYIVMNWQPDVYKYYGVDIYRSEIGSDNFVKLTNIGPISIDLEKQKNFKKSDIFFVDTLISNDKGYVYKFKSINYLGQESKFSDEIKVPIKDFEPPLAPFDFKVRPYSVEGFVRLTWDAIDEADLAGYNIYYSQDPESPFLQLNERLLPKDQKAYNTKKLKEGGYYFAVTTVDLAGNETTTGMMFGEIRDVTPPAAPQNLISKAESGKITLTWSPNTEEDLFGYYVQKSLSDSNNLDNDYVIMNSAVLTETTYEIKLPKNVKNEFVYRVVAIDTLYNISKPSINSLAQMPDVVPPKQPVLKNVTEVEGNIEVEWISNVDEDLSGYALLRKAKGDSIYTQINFSIIPKDVTAYKDRSSSPGVQYEYALKAIDKSGNESTLSAPFFFAKKKEKVDGKIEVSEAKFSSRKKEISIVWEFLSDEEVKGFVVYGLTNDGVLKPISGLSTDKEYRTKKYLEGKQKFEIRAYTTKGEIIKSELFEIDTKDI